MEKSMHEDLVPLQDDAQDAKIMQLVENLRHDSERDVALTSLVETYESKLAEVERAQDNPKVSQPKVSAHQRHIRTLLRLCVQCPHESVRTTLETLIAKVKECPAFHVPAPPRVCPSMYFDADDIPAVVGCNDEAEAEFVEAFRADGRVSHMTQLMSYHPVYLTRFRELHNGLLWDEGPLLLPERQLIAVMASARHNCKYLAEIHSKHFLDLGGDPNWLKGATHLPPKLRSLLEINAVLAHQPWRLSVEDIARLVKSGADSWSLNELVHALSIMCHFHALQSFVLACGLSPEVDLMDGDVAMAAGAEGPAEADGGREEQSVFAEVRAKLRAEQADDDEDDEEANLQQFADADAETEDSKSPQQQQDATASSNWFRRFEPSLYPRVSDPLRVILGHEDFNVKSKEYSVFRTQDFSWADQCYSTLSRYCPEIAELFDAEFSTIKDLTYGNIGSETGVNTWNFRWAIWNYTFRTKGIVNEEYMYYMVNKHVPVPVKSCVKTIVCYPQLSARQQWVAIDKFADSERVHIALLAMCARKQAGLLYALHAVSQFVTGQE